MANKKQIAIFKMGDATWNKWRERNPGTKVDLRGADLRWEQLRGANLRGVDFYQADLRGIILPSANLSMANLSCANLNGADLDGANLRRANLSEANLQGVDLRETDISSANLRGANLAKAWIAYTTVGDVDLSIVKGLDEVRCVGPAIIGVDTLYRSNGNIPESFLRGCGVPEDMIAYARSLRGRVIDFCSCFISHSAKDKRFCERVYADLQAKGVRVWYFPEDAKWGETVWGEIDRSIKTYDKLIVVCSKNSLTSSPVQREIERALNREDKEGKGILFPIRIDDYIFDKWEHERKADVVRKVVGDFSGWDKDAAKYDKAFDKLLKGLQAESTKV